MFRVWYVLALALALTFSASAAEPKVVKLWPGKAPGETKEIGPEKLIEPKKGQSGVKRVSDVSDPTITIYSPPKDKNTGVAVVVAPGGGYSILAIEHEGTQVCEWLNTLGVTAVLLKYRVPKREMQMPENLAALQDAQRAISVVRSMQTELAVNPTKVGMLGFSAGGNLTAWTSLAGKRYYEPLDKTPTASGALTNQKRSEGERSSASGALAIDEYSCEPNFALLIYPAYLADKGGELKPEYKVRKDSPPMFFAHSSDDPVSSENSVSLYLALKKNKVPAEMHLYATGGHGYGMQKVPHPCAKWPDQAADWMKARGLFDKPTPPDPNLPKK